MKKLTVYTTSVLLLLDVGTSISAVQRNSFEGGKMLQSRENVKKKNKETSFSIVYNERGTSSCHAWDLLSAIGAQ